MSRIIGLRFVWSLTALALVGCQEKGAPSAPTPPAVKEAGNDQEPENNAQTAGRDASDAPLDMRAQALAKGVGSHKIGGALALVFEPGMARADVEALVKDVTESGKARMLNELHETRKSKRGEVPVHVYEMQFLGAQLNVRSVQVTLFGEVLVGVRTLYSRPDPERVKKYAERLGEARRSEEWFGWWDRDADVIIQSSLVGRRYEVFDLAIAREVMPDVDEMMVEAWMRRYKVPPPWGMEPQPTPQ